MIVAGIMSGTSLDGVNVAAVELNGSKGWKLLEFQSKPYPKKLRERLLAVSNAVAHTGEVASLGFELGEIYARSILDLNTRVELIGCHGQTIFHGPACTLQLGEAQVIAERTGVPVVNNFRPRDMAAGGQGAPLVPFLDYLLFRHKTRNRVLLNLGGIANVSLIPAGAAPENVVAFDTGPANMVIDQLVWIATKGKRSYDAGGRIAAKAKPDAKLLRILLRDRYYSKKPPKSCGREQYGKEFIQQLLATQLPLDVLIATATLLTPLTIAESITDFPAAELIAGGGGTKNPMIMNHLRGLLPNTTVMTTDDFGLPAEAKEAVAFAIMARETWRRRPGNVPSATGAKRAVILGQVTYA
ncbi:MAG: anhydro-N-acetylmuramic acid kinase [Acidobacteria bacterium]|nr:anhydro-N-acetylmuramic acid kinase [Acidobacteriota bacterium]